MLGIARDKAYLNNFYKAKTMSNKATVVDKYAREKLDMTADIDIKDDNKNYFPVHTKSPLSSKFCQVLNKDEDVRLLCQACMCHHCNKFCLQNNKKDKHRSCKAGCDEDHFGRGDTPGMTLMDEAELE